MPWVPERLQVISNSLVLLLTPWLIVHLLTLNGWLALVWLCWLGIPAATLYLGLTLGGRIRSGLLRHLTPMLLCWFLVLLGLWLDFRTLGFFTYVRLCQTLLADTAWVAGSSFWQIWPLKTWTLVMMAVICLMMQRDRPVLLVRLWRLCWQWSLMLVMMMLFENRVLQWWPDSGLVTLEMALLFTLLISMTLTMPLLSRLNSALQWRALAGFRHFYLTLPVLRTAWRIVSRSDDWHR